MPSSESFFTMTYRDSSISWQVEADNMVHTNATIKYK